MRPTPVNGILKYFSYEANPLWEHKLCELMPELFMLISFHLGSNSMA